MGRVKYPNGKPCQCGCGQSAKKHIQDGIHKGWYKYAEGHQPLPALCDPIVREKCHETQRKRIPMFTRRIKEVYGKQYWEIKVPNCGNRWPCEHRYIIEQELGRELLSTEHVHHIDNNGLNNSRDNLILLTASEHARLTCSQIKKPMCRCECPNCGASLHHFKNEGKREAMRKNKKNQYG